MKIMLVVITSLFALSGCMTEATQKRFTQAGVDVGNCQKRVLDMQMALAQKASNKPQVMFKDERNAMMYLMVEKMAEVNLALIEAQNSGGGIDACDDVLVAMVRADAAKMAGINSTVRTGVSWGLGIVGLKVLADGFGPEAYSNPAGASTTTTYNNSRVVSNSPNSGGGTISASGEGMGIGNSFNEGNGQQVSGNMPRTSPVNQSDNVDNRPESNSGTNEEFDPADGEGNIDSEFPEGTPELF